MAKVLTIKEGQDLIYIDNCRGENILIYKDVTCFYILKCDDCKWFFSLVADRRHYMFESSCDTTSIQLACDAGHEVQCFLDAESFALWLINNAD